MGMRENMRGGCEFWKFGGARIGASKNWECIHNFLGREGFRERRRESNLDKWVHKHRYILWNMGIWGGGDSVGGKGGGLSWKLVGV